MIAEKFENKNLINPIDKREIEPSLIANVLLSMASLLEVTGWVGGITTDVFGRQMSEMDLPKVLWQVVHGSYDGRQGLWHATRDALLGEIGNGCKSLAAWNDRQKSADVVIALCQRTAHNLKNGKRAIDFDHACKQSATS